MILEIGMKHTVETLVTPENTAAKAGSGNLQVFGTPFMVALMENAALTLMAVTLPEVKGPGGTPWNQTPISRGYTQKRKLSIFPLTVKW